MPVPGSFLIFGIRTSGGFAEKIVAWQQTHGRNTLPWQNTRDPYRVWLSEVMLQQTQVTTVLGYYARFLVRFPDVADLAKAHADEVMAMWSGLGYYSRARNMHRCAQDVVAAHGGKFPETAELLKTLPGIGPSTAAAVASFCFGERVAIFDGNVKRVLTRVAAFAEDLAIADSENKLLLIASSLLPENDLQQAMPRYTQGVMDLGATLCTPRKPQCLICPVRDICKSFAEGNPEKYPVKTKKLKRSALRLSLLWAQRPDGSVWLERRPVTGIWGGLFCLPVFDSEESLLAYLPESSRLNIETLATFKHVLTHKDLYLSPSVVPFESAQQMPDASQEARPSDKPDVNAVVKARWYALHEWPQLGLPSPIRKLLESWPGHSVF